MNIKEQKKIVLNSILNALEENSELKSTSGVPQASILVDSKTWEIKHKAVTNVKVGNNFRNKWMKTDKDTHAEKIIFYNYKKLFNNHENESLTLIVTSMPCAHCLEHIIDSKGYNKISSIILLTKEYRKIKTKSFLSRNVENNERIEKFNNLSISIFDYNSDQELNSINENCLKFLTNFQEKYVFSFIDVEFIQNSSLSKKIIYKKEELNHVKDFLKNIEYIFECKLFIENGNEVIVKLDKIKKLWELNKNAYQKKSNKIAEFRKHKSIWNKNNILEDKSKT